jgi:hypothetical protein
MAPVAGLSSGTLTLCFHTTHVSVDPRHSGRLQVHIVNFSVGGPDFMDEPFVDKIRELSANGITVRAWLSTLGMTSCVII